MTPALSTAALGFFGFICPTSARSEERSANKIVQIKELSEMSPNLDQSPRLDRGSGVSDEHGQRWVADSRSVPHRPLRIG